jgi:hypothetical protein
MPFTTEERAERAFIRARMAVMEDRLAAHQTLLNATIGSWTAQQHLQDLELADEAEDGQEPPDVLVVYIDPAAAKPEPEPDWSGYSMKDHLAMRAALNIGGQSNGVIY